MCPAAPPPETACAAGQSHSTHDTVISPGPTRARSRTAPGSTTTRAFHVWSDTWQHHGPPCTARDLSVRLDVDVTIGSRTIHDCAEGPIRADHEITAIRAAALAGRVACECPRFGDNVNDLPRDADTQPISGVPGRLAEPAVPLHQAPAMSASQDKHRCPFDRPWALDRQFGQAGAGRHGQLACPAVVRTPVVYGLPGDPRGLGDRRDWHLRRPCCGHRKAETVPR